MSLTDLTQGLSRLWTPPAKQTLTQWSEENLILSSEYSARSGPIKLFGFQKPIFDAFTDPRVREIVLMCSTQMVKTLLLQAVIAFVIANDPGPILLVQPSDTDAKSFSKSRLDPMFRDCSVLNGLISESGPGKDGTILEKMFPGGSLSLVGSIAPGNLARRSIQYLLCDEVDKYPLSAGVEGDPIALAKKRLTTYQTRSKTILTCSPTLEDRSRIAKSYADSDQREAWVACPICKNFQTLKWEQVKWDSNLPAEFRAASAYYECIHCRSRWDDLQRWAACESVEFRAQKPFEGVAGFHINHLYSPFVTLSSLVSDFLKTKNNRQQFQVWWNTSLAETWKDIGITPDEEHLFARREQYAHGEDALIPRRGCFLTCGVDVQDDRLEYEVVAWGRGKESWSVDYGVVQAFAPNGHPLPVTSPEVWNELDRRVLQRDWNHEAGGSLPIMLMAIDTGYKPQLVYEFALRHPQPAYSANAGMRVHAVRSVVPIKGTDDDLKIISNISTENAARKRQGVRIVGVGTHTIKQELFDSLRHIKPNASEPVQNACHFPQYDKPYFVGLCGEHRIERNGKYVWERKNNVRNEPLDCRVYARAAATMCGLDRFTDAHWSAMEANMDIAVQPTTATGPGPAAVLRHHQPVRRVVRGFN